jgi:glycosyltransferase involved in cell wall biosynthesis
MPELEHKQDKLSSLKSIALIMPVYNEVGVIEKVIRQYADVLRATMPDVKFIIAEDGSTDGTKDILARLNREISFQLISGVERKGYTRAFKDALKLADTEWVFFSDSDGQHDPRDILGMINAREGYDIISGYKAPRMDPLHRVIISNVYNGLIAFMFGLKMKDIDSGFKLIRTDVIKNILDDVALMKYCVMSEFMIKAYLSGYSIKEVPVTHHPREVGTTAIFHPAQLPSIIIGLIQNLSQIKHAYKHRSRA